MIRGSNVVPFERDAGFYLQKGMFHYQKNKLDKALFYFQKAVSVEPSNPFNHYNLACMLSKLGQLKEANRVFLHIVTELDEAMTDCYFLLAVNYGILEEMEKSREFLMRYLQTDPEGDLSFEAMELLDALDDDAGVDQLPAYAERDLFMERILKSANVDEISSLFSSSQSFRRALNNRLYDGPDEFKEEIIRFYGDVGGKEAQEVLRGYVKNPWIKERFRQLALLELKNLGQRGNLQVYSAGQIRDIDLRYYPIHTPVWRQEWQQVVECAIGNMRKGNCYDEGFFDDVQAIWLDFINTVYPDTPKITKVQTWAAALEYSLARFHYLSLTQKELALEYGVSVASISLKFKEINNALRIDEKAQQNMLCYLKDEEE